MHVLLRLRRFFVQHFVYLSWQGLLAVIVGFVLSSLLLLSWAGETKLVSRHDFIYWLMVTASTVGFGDLSPQTTLGKYIVGLYVIPFGLGLFAMSIGRVAAFSVGQWKKGIRGLRMLNVDNHILVVGWSGHRTLHLLRLLQQEAKTYHHRKIVLCVTDDIDNPMPDSILFCRVESFKSDQDMDRASVDKASCIIVNTPSDDLTMTTALYCYSKNRVAHHIVYFSDDSLSALLKSHCPNIECMPSVAVEMQAKAAMDPGSSALHQELLDASAGMTQYSAEYPENLPETAILPIFNYLKQKHNATLIGLSRDRKKILINPPLEQPIHPGDTFFYIAAQRIHDFNWGKIDDV
ncbi:MAG: potassium channel family protein [Gammaproteobacteria bacterium]